MDGPGFSSQEGQKIILFSKNFESSCPAHPEVSPVVAQVRCELTTHLHLELRLRMREATLPLPPYPFSEGTETSLPLVNTVGQRLAYHRPKNNDTTAGTEQTIEKLNSTVL